MWFSRKQVAKSPPKVALALKAHEGANQLKAPLQQTTTKSRGDAAEADARRFLEGAGLRFVEANFKTPGRGGGEIDLIMRSPDGTLVFVEVRQRASASHGGAGASISPVKQRRLVFAARHYLMRFPRLPPCRFDVVLVQGRPDRGKAEIQWLQAAFDAS